MTRLTDHCICIRHGDYSETSQVLTLLGERHGKHAVIAKGIKRGTKTRFATGIDLLERGTAVLAPPRGASGLATLIEWEQITTNSHLRSSLDVLEAALYAAEVANALTEEADPHPAMFAGLCGLVADLADSANIRGKLVRFQRIALSEAGLMPALNECVGCRRAVGVREPIFFSSAEGGLICRECEPGLIEKRRMTQQARAAISVEARPEHAGAREAFEVLNYHIEVVLDRRLRLGQSIRDR